MYTNFYFLWLMALVIGFHDNDRDGNWSLKANYYESCSCNAPCPCPYGLPMNNSFCKLNGLVDVEHGHYDDTELDGVKVILSGSSGQWGEYIFSETTTKEQRQAMEKILGIIDVAGFDTLLDNKLARIRFEHTDRRVVFSTPDINVVMDMVRGHDGQPVIVQNLPKKIFEKYSPYLSHENMRWSPDSAYAFSFSGKAGFVSSWDLNDSDFANKKNK